MKKYLFFLPLLLLAGCWDTNQPERMYYLHGIAFDFVDGQYEIYAQIIDFTNIAKSEQPSNSDAIQIEVGIARGRTFNEAFFNLYKTMDERLFFGHLTYVIFSENVAKENKVRNIINTLIKYRELRYNAWVYVTKTPLEELMLTSPILNKAITLSKLSDPLNSYSQSSLIEPMNIREVLLYLDEPSHEAIIPYVEDSKNWVTKKERDTVYSVTGVGIISEKEGLLGFLLEQDVKGMQFMTSDTRRSELTFQMEGFGDPAVTVVIENVDPKIRAVISENPIQFDIDVKLIVQITETIDKAQTKKLIEKIEKTVKEEIKRTYEEGIKIQADVYRLSETVYRNHIREWKNIEQDGKVPLTENSIRNLNVEVVQTIGKRTLEIPR
ncbi:spore gernimation protein GerC [Solibacillus sp. R5-41]|uniref:Ger(x)C family spore germination protein n=1 Tax=Solibacillus sp. R5-41 TaxID=2048654 RepID=UPI000C129668|nr:Ger(x)C family spore germination protein [Solibacillus sp. R5-41]ATP41601.1 spore gernimation protein GerC [Solibacillus sp. R5-41]